MALLHATEGRFELQMSASFDIKDWWWIGGMTVIESKNQVVIYGQRTESDPWYLYTFQKNLDGYLVETQMDTPCQHDAPFITLTTVVQNRKELLTVGCYVCNDIKLVDMEIKHVAAVYKSPSDEPVGVCSGRDGGLFVAFKSGNILQLDSSFSVINKFHDEISGSVSMCCFPAPNNAIVFQGFEEIAAFLAREGRLLWKRKFMKFAPHCFLFWGEQGVLLASDIFKPEVLFLNPTDGSILQTMSVPYIDLIEDMCLCGDQLVMIQRTEKGMALSYYSLKAYSVIAHSSKHQSGWEGQD